MSMPALTIWSPFGSMIAAGVKTIETRTHNRYSSLQGQRIAIHQGKKQVPTDRVFTAARAVGASRAATWLMYHSSECPRGHVIATAFVPTARALDGSIDDNVAACFETEGLYGLILTDIRQLEVPVKVKGQQGVWQWDQQGERYANQEEPTRYRLDAR